MLTERTLASTSSPPCSTVRIATDTLAHTLTHMHTVIMETHAPHWHTGVAKKKMELSAQLAREMVDK